LRVVRHVDGVQPLSGEVRAERLGQPVDVPVAAARREVLLLDPELGIVEQLSTAR
jgi:hypothetical protein